MSLFVVEEDTEGVAKAASVGTEAIQPLADGMEIKPAKEVLERNILSGSIGYATPRTGTKSVTATIPCEFRAAETTGAAPDYDLLLKGALGDVRVLTEVTSTTGHTASSINLAGADASGYAIGDIVVIKDSGKYHITPIKKVNPTSIDLLIPCGTAPANAVKIAAARVYVPADDGHPSLTIEAWYEGVRKEVASGCKVTGLTINNFSTGKLADLSFKLDGMGFSQVIDTLGVTPDFQTSMPPIILNACVYQDGVAVPVNEVTLSVENSIGFITSTCSANGKISSRITGRKVSGSLNPYLSSTDVANFTKFDTNAPFSLFFRAYNPTTVAGEFNQVVAVYLPNCLITELGKSDKDGIVQESISFTCSRGVSNDTDEIFIAVI